LEDPSLEEAFLVDPLAVDFLAHAWVLAVAILVAHMVEVLAVEDHSVALEAVVLVEAVLDKYKKKLMSQKTLRIYD
jgi:hypothetical protein